MGPSGIAETTLAPAEEQKEARNGGGYREIPPGRLCQTEEKVLTDGLQKLEIRQNTENFDFSVGSLNLSRGLGTPSN